MSRPPQTIPKDLKTVARVFEEAGFECWLVGGAVRDGLLGRSSEDYDLATDALPETVTGLFRRTIPTGIKHGTVTILLGSHQFETTTFRTDGDYSDGRRPDQVSYSTDIRDDLARRDFSINAIAWNLIEDRLFDPHDGQGDLKRRLIKAIGEPAERFSEDALRPIRACRFASQLGFRIDPPTLDAIEPVLDGVKGLSAERIWDELKKIFAAPKPSTAFRLFKETGLLQVVLPELQECVGVGQKGRHVLDVFDHSLAACDAAPPDNMPVRAAALFHDIGKPRVKARDEGGEVIFHGHDSEGAVLTEDILRRYKASNANRDRIVRLVGHHMFHYTSDWSDAAVRRFITRAGLDLVDDLMALRIADATAIAGRASSGRENLPELLSRIDGILRSDAALSIKDLEIDGRILMKELGLNPSPALGSLLDHLLDSVLEDPEVNQKDKLLDMARRWLEIYG